MRYTLVMVWGMLAGHAVAQAGGAVEPPLPQRAPPADVAVEPGQVEEVRQIAGRRCGVRVQAADSAAGQRAIATALTEVRRVLLNYAEPARTTEVHSVNANAGTDEVIVSQEAHSLLQRALDLCHRSGGAYDPTVATWDYLWNFRHQPFVPPLAAEIAARRPAAGCKQLVIKPTRAVRLMHPGARLTLEGMATGMALERAAQVLREQGIHDFRVTVGDDVYAQGRVGTRHWHVTAPNGRRSGEALALLYLSSHAAVTRSDSDRTAERNGKRYHDVLDARSGLPASRAVQATVISSDAVLADALSHAVLVLGPQAGIALLQREKNVEGFVIDLQGRVYATKGMTDLARLPARVDVAAASTLAAEAASESAPPRPSSGPIQPARQGR
jgi:thiamine biosynthesis lipoprotein